MGGRYVQCVILGARDGIYFLCIWNSIQRRLSCTYGAAWQPANRLQRTLGVLSKRWAMAIGRAVNKYRIIITKAVEPSSSIPPTHTSLIHHDSQVSLCCPPPRNPSVAGISLPSRMRRLLFPTFLLSKLTSRSLKQPHP